MSGNIHTYSIDFHRQESRFSARLAMVATPLGNLQGWFECLSGAEKQKLATHGSLRQTEFLAGRVLAKQLLLEYSPGHDLQKTSILPGVFGQPVLYSSLPGIDVCIAHKHNLVAALMFDAAHPVAIDIEQTENGNESAVISQLTEKELQFHSGMAYFTGLWSAKEALSKILKCGLTLPFELLETKKIAFFNQGEGFEGEFVNFSQYRFRVYAGTRCVIGLVYPRKSTMIIEDGFLHDWHYKWQPVYTQITNTITNEK